MRKSTKAAGALPLLIVVLILTLVVGIASCGGSTTTTMDSVTVRITASTDTIEVDIPLQLNATVDNMAGTFIWTASGGTVSQTGLFSASNVGVYTITAEEPGGATASVEITVVAKKPPVPIAALRPLVDGKGIDIRPIVNGQSVSGGERIYLDKTEPLANVTSMVYSDMLQSNGQYFLGDNTDLTVDDDGKPGTPEKALHSGVLKWGNHSINQDLSKVSQINQVLDLSEYQEDDRDVEINLTIGAQANPALAKIYTANAVRAPGSPVVTTNTTTTTTTTTDNGFEFDGWGFLIPIALAVITNGASTGFVGCMPDPHDAVQVTLVIPARNPAPVVPPPPANQPPTARLVPSPSTGNAPLDVTWDASDSTDSDGTIVRYDWDMDNNGTFEVANGGTSRAANYAAAGSYTVGVRVTDDDGSTDTATATATVTATPPPPVDDWTTALISVQPLEPFVQPFLGEGKSAQTKLRVYAWKSDGVTPLPFPANATITATDTIGTVITGTDDGGFYAEVYAAYAVVDYEAQSLVADKTTVNFRVTRPGYADKTASTTAWFVVHDS